MYMEEVEMKIDKEKKFIGILRFDAITTFEEFQGVIMYLMELGFNLEFRLLPKEIRNQISPWYSGWQIEITKASSLILDKVRE
jgi:hypothetical protein